LLTDIEFRFRDLGLIGPDDSIHWVGRQDRRQTWCLCELHPAALVRPRPAEWKTLSQLSQAIGAMTALVRTYHYSAGSLAPDATTASQQSG
jgi:hypothetical protein